MTKIRLVFTAMKTANRACGHHDLMPNDSEQITDSEEINVQGDPEMYSSERAEHPDGEERGP